MKRMLLIILVPVFCSGMEVKELPTKLEQFELLPDKLKVKIISHLFDKHARREIIYGMCTYTAVDKIKPFLKTCKRYYLQDFQFTGKLLEIICEEFKSYQDTIVTAGKHLPTPACKRLFMSHCTKNSEFIKEIDRAIKDLCPEPCKILLNDVKNGKIRFKECVVK